MKSLNTKNQDLSAIFMICIGYLGYSIMDALSKWLVTELPATQITTTINAVSAIMLCILMLKKGGLNSFKVEDPKLHVIRTLFFLFVPYFVLKSLSILELAEFYPIAFLAPLTIIIASYFFLGEALEKAKVTMTFIGLIGVMFVVQGQIAQQWEGFLYALLAVIGITGFTIMTRKVKHCHSIYALSFYPAIALTFAYMPFAFYNYKIPTDPKWIILFISGVCVFIGQVGCVIGFTKASSVGTVAPYHYTQMIWGIIFGYIIFEHVPSTSALIGAVLIIYSGLFIALYTTDKSKSTYSK